VPKKKKKTIAAVWGGGPQKVQVNQRAKKRNGHDLWPQKTFCRKAGGTSSQADWAKGSNRTKGGHIRERIPAARRKYKSERRMLKQWKKGPPNSPEVKLQRGSTVEHKKREVWGEKPQNQSEAYRRGLAACAQGGEAN